MLQNNLHTGAKLVGLWTNTWYSYVRTHDILYQGEDATLPKENQYLKWQVDVR